MASFEIIDSGRFSGGRSNFSQTCSLLSQYLKEKGSFGDLTLGLTPSSEQKGAPMETMNFLSVIENSASRTLPPPPPAAVRGAKDEAPTKSAAETAPMTVFYGGKVMVFNDFPADKVKEILALASKSSATAQPHPNAAFAPLHAAQSPAESTTSVPNVSRPTFGSAQPTLDSDLPIARKNSLARFLEKRRDRITANAPYPVVSKAAAPVKVEAWLGLAQQHPFQFQSN